MTVTLTAPAGFLGDAIVGDHKYSVTSSGTVVAQSQDVESLLVAGFSLPTGPTGPQGASGPAGVTGPTGPTGPAAGGATSTEWFLTFPGADATNINRQVPDSTGIVLGDQTYVFVIPSSDSAPFYNVPNRIATHVEVRIPGNLNGILNNYNALVYLCFDIAAGIAGGLIAEDSVAPTGVQVDIGSYGALAAAVSGDPTQSSPWPALRFFSDDPFPVQYVGPYLSFSPTAP